MNDTTPGPHLFVDISAHGLGHLAQTAPVLNALRHRLPCLRLTIRSALPKHRLQARLAGQFTHIEGASDFGYVMRDATDIDLAASAQAYRTAHTDWPARVADEAAWLHALAPDLVLSNVAYLPLAGATRAGIPSLAMCSLNWADLFAHFFAGQPWAPSIQAEIDAAYAGASFLRLTPAMPMPRLSRVCDLPPVALPAQPRRNELRTALGCPETSRIVLIAFGGIPKELPLVDWPPIPGVCWLNGTPASHGATGTPALSDLPFSFSDVLASVDAVLTKPGYGTFVEAACAGTPVLYLRRPDWPEQDALIDWLHANARALEVSARDLHHGELAEALLALWQQPAPRPPTADGVAEVAERLSLYLTRHTTCLNR